jgi:hypothetical protein
MDEFIKGISAIHSVRFSKLFSLGQSIQVHEEQRVLIRSIDNLVDSLELLLIVRKEDFLASIAIIMILGHVTHLHVRLQVVHFVF